MAGRYARFMKTHGTAHSRRSRLLAVLALLLALALQPSADSSAPQPSESFVRRDGRRLVVGADAHQIRLRGVNFNNQHWEFDRSVILNSDHHSEVDFERLARLGMNSIRFGLSYVVFEDDQNPFVYHQEAWDWLDQNLAWAADHGIYLILDMHVPQGGYQGGSDLGPTLWNDRQNQERLAALWRAIAERYRDEPAIAAFDLVNEPTPTGDSSQWPTLAQELIDKIREVDTNHLIVVQRSFYDEFPFLLDDDNVMYDAHFYDPGQFTIQYEFFSGSGDGGFYPDPEVSAIPGEFVFADATFNPHTAPGDSDWTFYEGELHLIDDPRIVSAIPAFNCDRSQGTVFFDEFFIREYDRDRQLVRQVMEIDIVTEEDVYLGLVDGTRIDPYPSDVENWSWWTADDGGRHWTLAEGHGEVTSVAIAEVTAGCSLAGSPLIFAVRQGHHYQISGWMKGEGVIDDGCYLSLEFGQLPSGEEFSPLDRSYLEFQLGQFAEFSVANDVPINIGEFGAIRWTFEDGRGGLSWIRDTVSILEAHGFSYQLYDYHSPGFGLFRSAESVVPEESVLNQELYDFLFHALRSSHPRQPSQRRSSDGVERHRESAYD